MIIQQTKNTPEEILEGVFVIHDVISYGSLPVEGYLKRRLHICGSVSAGEVCNFAKINGVSLTYNICYSQSRERIDSGCVILVSGFVVSFI